MNSLKNIIATLAAILTLGTMQGQISGYVKVPYDFKEKSVLVEPNVFYKLPGNVSAYTFMQLRSDKKYYGKTFLKKDIWNKVVKKGNLDSTVLSAKIKATLKHDDELYTKSGIGLCLDAAFPSRGIDAAISYLPLWIGKDGKRKEGTIDLYFSMDEKAGLPKGCKIETFGEWSAKTGNYNYGEFRLQQCLLVFKRSSFKTLSIAYNPIFKAYDSPIPGLEHRVSAVIGF